MKVMLVNGSSHLHGTTMTALEEIELQLTGVIILTINIFNSKA